MLQAFDSRAKTAAPAVPGKPQIHHRKQRDLMKRMQLVFAIMTLLAGNMNAGPEAQQIVDTVSTIFTAAQTDDVAKFDSVTAPDFYLFEGGARLNGDAIMGLIKGQHLAGKRYEWNVTEPDVHISGDSAWIAYINKGSITDASGTTKQNWLESAFLEKRAGNWKIVFMHSTRVPMTPQENRGK
jgi:ketosteroid isomerase-like protein